MANSSGNVTEKAISYFTDETAKLLPAGSGNGSADLQKLIGAVLKHDAIQTFNAPMARTEEWLAGQKVPRAEIGAALLEISRAVRQARIARLQPSAPR